MWQQPSLHTSRGMETEQTEQREQTAGLLDRAWMQGQ